MTVSLHRGSRCPALALITLDHEGNDISKSSYGVLRVKSTFAGAYEVLTSRLYVRAQEIADRRSGRSRSHRGDGYGTGDDPGMSVLVGIMGVSPDVSPSSSR